MTRLRYPLNVSVSKELIEKIEEESKKLGIHKSLYMEILLRKIFGLEPKFGGEKNGEG